MKKLFMTMLAVLACGAAYALPVGNPCDASLLCDGLIWEGHCGDPCDPCLTWCDAFSLRVGFYGDYVFNRHLKVDSDDNDSRIEHAEIYTNAGFIAANFWDRVDLFFTFGATNIYLDTNANAFGGTAGNRFELETDTDFSWSIGLRGTIWECGCTCLGGEFQYFRTRPDVRRVTVAATTSVYNDNLLDSKYSEWQVGLGISHRINMLVPYIAVKWSHAHFRLDNAVIADFAPDITLFNQENDKHWGYAIGVSLVDCEKASITVEGRFGDEKALYVNGQVRF